MLHRAAEKVESVSTSWCRILCLEVRVSGRECQMSNVCISVSSRILQHRINTTSQSTVLFWGYISVICVCTYLCPWVYLHLFVSVNVYLLVCLCLFCPFLHHMSQTVLDIWWPYLCSGTLNVLQKPWELLLCSYCGVCGCIYVCVCGCVCVWWRERERERDDLRFDADVFTSWVQLIWCVLPCFPVFLKKD